MKTVTVKQIQQLDDAAINEYGIPSLILMENAGRQVFKEVMRRFHPDNVAVICGRGNNAGDGFVVARHLNNAGVKTRVILIGHAGQLKQDAQINYDILRRLKYSIEEMPYFSKKVPSMIKKADVVIDAIFGVGLNRDIEDPFKSFIKAINHEAKKVVAVDAPSGLDGTHGTIHGVSIKADLTVTFSLAKRGFYRNHGPQQTGKVVVADIGIPGKIKNKILK